MSNIEGLEKRINKAFKNLLLRIGIYEDENADRDFKEGRASLVKELTISEPTRASQALEQTEWLMKRMDVLSKKIVWASNPTLVEEAVEIAIEISDGLKRLVDLQNTLPTTGASVETKELLNRYRTRIKSLQRKVVNMEIAMIEAVTSLEGFIRKNSKM